MLKKLIFLFILIQGHQVFAAVEKQQAVDLISKISSVMKPLVDNQDLEIKIEFKSMNNPGAFSKWEKQKKIGLITFSDELFYVENVDLYAVAMIACHEYGHFLGGAPYVEVMPTGSIFTARNKFEKMSVEGQADFFASTICAPLVESFLTETTDDPILLSFCEGKRSDCLTTINAIRSAADSFVEILAGYNYHDTYTSLFDVSRFQSDRTLNYAGEYPTMQCRVQTMVQGLSCFEILEDGTCLNEIGQTIELRPKCWFKENR
ncbi:MAG: hypothetical protein EP319_11820 [Deltaproteobacteria bacterium]|nr:MAG: hypothetical protein EP319_11820 [Deltaproteobacteria bacterium]